MKCYICGNRLSEMDYCTSCGADVRVYKRILRISNQLYNEGLAKAKVRDLSGAVVSLRQSLKFNKQNINARNLLGLVYFEMGEAVLALSEWIISNNLESKKNVADEYIKILQSNPTKLDTINQTIKKYNQALAYCYQGSNDLAIIQLKKVLSINGNLISGYLLLALLYMEQEDYEKARRTLLRAIRIDSNNTTLHGYLKEINTVLNERAEKSGGFGKKDKQNTEIYTYQSGNETIIQPLYTKERVGFSSVINIVIGIVIGVLICRFLVLPSMIEKRTDAIDAKFKLVSEQLAAEQASKQEVEQSLNTSEDEKQALQAQIDEMLGEKGIAATYDHLIKAGMAYMKDADDTQTIMEDLGEITEDEVNSGTEAFKEYYGMLSGDTSAKAIEVYVENGKTAIRANDYEQAIEEFTRAYNMDSTNSDVLMNLAHAYRQSGDTKKADELYRKIITDFPESQNAADAVGYITDN